MDLLPKLKQIKVRHDELEGMLGQGDATNDMERFTRLNKEYAETKPFVAAYEELSAMVSERADLEEMSKSDDADVKEMASEELKVIIPAIPKLEDKIQIMLLPKDEADDRNVIIEIRAGTGGDEAALFAANIMRMYIRYAEIKGWKTEVMDSNTTDSGGVKEAVLQMSGEGVFGRMKYESGVHRVQRVPETESQGRIHTSAITVAVLPEAEEVDIDINPADLRIDVYRASGAGGQHVNKTESAVRITHIPTGTVSQCQDQSSQHKNKATAMKMLTSRMYDAQREVLDQERSDNRKSQVGTGDRSARIRTYNYPQSRVTDHRINLTLHSLDAIVAGDALDDVIESLLAEDQIRRLSAIGES
ncbi:MAG: peptide chain release factor 1 [bacterium]|jgi:peptide chain release factor 1